MVIFVKYYFQVAQYTVFVANEIADRFPSQSLKLVDVNISSMRCLLGSACARTQDE